MEIDVTLPFRDAGGAGVACRKCGAFVTVPPDVTHVESSWIDGYYQFKFVRPEDRRMLAGHGCMAHP